MLASTLVERYTALAEFKRKLLAHPIYAQVNSLPRLRIFMASHVFAVWDFMSLLKRLQRDLTCTDLPWLPVTDAVSARLINEIVLAEESDVGLDGTPISHLGLYLAAMGEVGADTRQFRGFARLLHEGATVEQALNEADVPPHVEAFVTTTIEIARHARLDEVLAVFLHGREDIIPAMFERLLHGLDGRLAAPRFAFYLHRHIDLDAVAHGPAATEILDRRLAADPAAGMRAIDAAIAAVEARIDFFTAIGRLAQPA